MGLFGTKDPMATWRRRHSAMAELVDRTGWEVDLQLGIVTTARGGIPVTVILMPPMTASAAGIGTSVVIEAGRQAEATLANRVDNDVHGPSFEVRGWQGVAEPGNGLIDGHFSGPDQELVTAVVAAVDELLIRVGARSTGS